MLETADGHRAFRIPVVSRPDAVTPGTVLDFTLVADDKSVEGQARIP